MASSLRNLLTERRYPFLLTLALLLLLFISLLILSTDEGNRLFSSFLLPPKLLPLPYRNLTDQSQQYQQQQLDPTIVLSQPQQQQPEKAEKQIDKGSEEIDFQYEWKRCPGAKETADYIPCLDNWKAIKKLKSKKHMEHRERHCPQPPPKCLVPLPQGYRVPVPWPQSRDKIWFNNVPHPKLVEYKKDQNWVRKSGDYLVFPGGGTQFKYGVASYVRFIEKILPTVDWGRRTRVVLDVGCGVASFGGHLLDRDVLTMSFAPKDEHEAQIQLALERGIPAILAVIGTQKLSFPDNVFDLIHCARCRVHWHGDGGKPLMELNRVLRPGGYFIWSATPVYLKDQEHQNVWNAMVALVETLCWTTVVKSTDDSGIGVVIYRKPVSNTCYKKRKVNMLPLCSLESRSNVSWYTPLDSCLAQIPGVYLGQEYNWPSSWPERLNDGPSSLPDNSDGGFTKKILDETENWRKLVSNVYVRDLAINWSSIRNVMDMNAGLGGFAAALIDQPLWVMNSVPIHGPDTLSTIFSRGLIGVYHDWCESFNTYPRTYDLLHSSFLFENLTKGVT